MTARTANAFMLSATLHALFAAVMLYTAYALKNEIIDQSKVFELVAGEGDNWAATEAPALGTPGGDVEFKLPPGRAFIPPPIIEPYTPPAPDPVVPAPVEAVAPPKEEPKPAPKTETLPNFEKTIKRKMAAVAYKQKAQRDKEAKEAAKAAALAQKNAEIAARKAELLAQQSGGGGTSKLTKIDAEGIAKGVLGGSTMNKTGGAGGKALSREEQDLLGTYIALLKQHLREVHEKPTGLSDQLAAKAEFYVGADGAISKASIVQSSGNAEFDQTVLTAIRNVRTIGSRPDGQGGFLTVRFRMKDED